MAKICINAIQAEALRNAIKKGEITAEVFKKTKSSDERITLLDKYLGDGVLSRKIAVGIEERLYSAKENVLDNYINNISKEHKVPVPVRDNLLKKLFKMREHLAGGIDKESAIKITEEAKLAHEARVKKYVEAGGDAKDIKERPLDLTTKIGEDIESKQFLEELVATKFGVYITPEESHKIFKLTQELEDARNKLDFSEDVAKNNTTKKEHLEYGVKLIELERLEEQIKRRGLENFLTPKEFAERIQMLSSKEKQAAWSRYIIDGGFKVGDAVRAAKASGDISYVLRQGWKMFTGGITRAVTTLGKDTDMLEAWWKMNKKGIEAVKSAYKYGDERFYDAVAAEVASRPNAYNGVYEASDNGYGFAKKGEEIFQSSLPSDLADKVSKRLNIFKISEIAFKTAILQANADLADLTIATLRKGGHDVFDKDVANVAGHFVGEFVGKAHLGKFEMAAKPLSSVIFAPRFAVSKFMPYIRIAKGITTDRANPAATLAARNHLESLAGTAGILAFGSIVKSMINGEDAIENLKKDLDPRNTQFGKIVSGTLGFDATGGDSSVVKLITALVAKTKYDANLKVWKEKSIFETSDGKAIWDFATGKFAPALSIAKTLLSGEHFGGKELNTTDMVKELFIPITIENFAEEAYLKGNMSGALSFMIAEGLGANGTDLRFKPKKEEWTALLNTNEKAYWTAVDELWKEMYPEIKKKRADKAFQKLSEEKQTKIMTTMLENKLNKVIKQDKYRKIYSDKVKKDKEEEKAKKAK